MEKVIISAISENNVLGKDNDIVWHLPADLAFLQQQINDCYRLTGRRSYQSGQGDELFGPDSNTIIITRDPSFRAPPHQVVHSIEEAIQVAESAGAERLCILGGGQVYRQTIDIADKLILTRIHATFEGDTFFPEIDMDKWKIERKDDYSADSENPYDYSFVTYVRL